MTTAAGGVYNAVITLGCLYWASGCKPLPREACEMAALCRYAPPRWDRSQASVMSVLSDILPVLAERHRVLSAGYARMIDGARKAGLMSRERLSRAQQPRGPAQISDHRSSTTPHSPTHTPPYKGRGTVDTAKRNDALAANAKASGQARLSEARSSK